MPVNTEQVDELVQRVTVYVSAPFAIVHDCVVDVAVTLLNVGAPGVSGNG